MHNSSTIPKKILYMNNKYISYCMVIIHKIFDYLLAHILSVFTSSFQHSLMEFIQSNKT